MLSVIGSTTWLWFRNGSFPSAFRNSYARVPRPSWRSSPFSSPLIESAKGRRSSTPEFSTADNTHSACARKNPLAARTCRLGGAAFPPSAATAATAAVNTDEHTEAPDSRSGCSSSSPYPLLTVSPPITRCCPSNELSPELCLPDSSPNCLPCTPPPNGRPSSPGGPSPIPKSSADVVRFSLSTFLANLFCSIGRKCNTRLASI
mmetsp:Transcript_44730/g.88354  ORF Transcript_44730/g.88354 Transcript_44730/m.88354 type:complete len:204 (-) Transcript_44730:437-1048(-)